MACRDLSRIIRFLTCASLFLAPLDAFLMYVPLVPAVLLAVFDRAQGARRWQTGPMAKAAAGFFACSACSAALSYDPAFSFFNWLFLPCMYGALYVLLATYLVTESDERRLLDVFLAGAACVVCYGIFQFADVQNMANTIAAQDWVDPERFPLLYRRMYSTLENPNLLAGYLLMMIGLFCPFALMERRRDRRLLLWAVLVLLGLCLLLTYSRGAWLSLLAMAAVMAVLYDRRIWLLFLLVPVVLLFYHGQITERFLSLFSGEDTSILLRLALWESTEAMIADHPFAGIGWGAYFLAYPDYNFFIQDPSVIIYHAHNMYLSIAAEIGLPGALCYFLLFFGHGLLAVRLYRSAASPFRRAAGLGAALAVTGMAVYGVGDYVLFSRAVSFCFWGICAFAAVCAAGRDRAAGSHKNIETITKTLKAPVCQDRPAGERTENAGNR